MKDIFPVSLIWEWNNMQSRLHSIKKITQFVISWISYLNSILKYAHNLLKRNFKQQAPRTDTILDLMHSPKYSS